MQRLETQHKDRKSEVELRYLTIYRRLLMLVTILFLQRNRVLPEFRYAFVTRSEIHSQRDQIRVVDYGNQWLNRLLY